MLKQTLLYIGALAVCGVLLSACDGRIAFPGFDDPPGQEEAEIPPPPQGLPEPTDTPEPPVPAEDPVTSDTPNTEDTEQEPDMPPESPDLPATPAPTPTPTDIPADETADPAPPEETDPVVSPPPAPPEAEEDEVPEVLPEPAFSYRAPGHLAENSGLGSRDETIYAPDMVFPIKDAPAYPQSMVFQPGGFRYAGDLPGDECVPQNYEYPWQDNFCERGRPARFQSAACPAGSGVHLGQDIRVGDAAGCNAMRQTYRTNPAGITKYKVVAAEDGVISNISSYTVTLRAGPRTYRYLHMNMRALQVSVGDQVTAGQHIGYVSKDFGGNPTTFHLHFVLKVNTGSGSLFVPPYTSLVASYARRQDGPGEELERPVLIASDQITWDPEEVFEFIE